MDYPPKGLAAPNPDHLSQASPTPTRPTIERLPGVLRRISLSRSWLFAAVASGQFPKPVKLGQRAVGWRSQDIDVWIESRTRSGE